MERKTISLRKIAIAVMLDIHEGMPEAIRYSGEVYTRRKDEINYVSKTNSKLLHIDLLDLYYDLSIEILDEKEEKCEKIKELKSKIEDLQDEIDKLSEDC